MGRFDSFSDIIICIVGIIVLSISLVMTLLSIVVLLWYSDAQSREELLRDIACAHLREIDIDSWKKASLGSSQLKGKVSGNV